MKKKLFSLAIVFLLMLSVGIVAAVTSNIQGPENIYFGNGAPIDGHGMADGSFYIDITNDALYQLQKSGSDHVWVLICSFQGTQGPQGLQGEQGETGVQGPQGIQGEQGPQGDTGVQGIPGPKGLTGIQGSQGPKGDTGATGATGSQGSQGPKGDKGTIGNTGPKGDKGDKGDQGIPGPRGMNGEQGPQGIPGKNGTNGKDGKDGVNGTVWFVGTEIPSNETGPSLLGKEGDLYLNIKTFNVYQKHEYAWIYIGCLKAPPQDVYIHFYGYRVKNDYGS